MTLTDLQSFLDKIQLPCTYTELMAQCELNCIETSIVLELQERFQEEFQDTEELIDEDNFEELQNYFDEEFYRQDE